MEHRNCLNCEKPVANNFCSYCGQKTATHRMDLKHLFLHDLVHGVWHLERGMLFTIKETIVRPGQAAMDYLSGRRARYYNVFYLILLTIGANIALNHLYRIWLPAPVEDSIEIERFVIDNVKFILIGWVPFLAFNGYVIMDRLHLNLAEHLIVSGISLLGSLLLCIPLFFVEFLVDYGYDAKPLKWTGIILTLLMVFYPIWTYINAAGKHYKWWEFLWRFVVFYGLLAVELMVFLFVLIFSFGGISQLPKN